MHNYDNMHLIMKWTSVALKTILSFAAVTVLALSTCAPNVYAASASAPFTTGAKVSFTFDDGFNSALTQAAPVLDKYGFPGTEYVVTGCVGMVTVPNTCSASPNASYLTWDEIAQLNKTYGWEIASHTASHPQLATDLSSGVLSAQQLADELSNSQTELAAHGISATDFADPYGDYSSETIRQIAKYYASHRAFADQGTNSFPYNDYLLTVRQVQGDVSVDTVKGYIDQAKAQDSWLILVFHDIKADDDPTYNAAQDAYQYKAGDLDQIAAYVQSQNVPVTDIAHGLANSETNLFANGNFNNGVADGWIASDPEKIKSDQAGNGSYDGTAIGPAYSISLTGAEEDASLFSPVVLVDPAEAYVLKSYVNVLIPGGEVDFYIDEYDADNNWISGYYYDGVIATANPTVSNLNFLYEPTSSNVAKMSLQVIVHGATTAAYVDNIQMFPLSDLIVKEDVTTPEETEEPAPATTTGGNGAEPSQTAILATSVVTDGATASPSQNTGGGQVKSATTDSGITTAPTTEPAVTANTTQNKAAAVNGSKVRKTWLWALILFAAGTTLIIIRSRRVPAAEPVSHEEPNKKSKS